MSKRSVTVGSRLDNLSEFANLLVFCTCKIQKHRPLQGKDAGLNYTEKALHILFNHILTVNHKQNKAQCKYRIEGSFLTYCFSQGDPAGHRRLRVTAAAAQGILLPATGRGSCCNRLQERICVFKTEFQHGQ